MMRAPTGGRWLPRASLVLLMVTGLLGSPAGTPPARAASCPSATGERPITHQPWANLWLTPERAWPLGRSGAGVKIAVVDTGVNATHAQLKGAVLRGVDLIQSGADGRLDCAGHGTAVASLIAGRPAQGVGFVGLAPRAQILPVRVAERVTDDIDPGRVAKGIRWAATHGAAIINVSLTLPDHPSLRSAVADAVRRGVVVVATVGDGSGGRVPAGPPYPAGYDGVLGVRASGKDGQVTAGGWSGGHVDLVAPGRDMITVAPILGHTTVWSGSDMATAVVSGSAALIRAGQPGMTGPTVADRLLLTADPAPGGPHSGSYGYGYVNPYRALTEPVIPGPTRSATPQVLPARAVPQADTRVADAAGLVAGTLAGATALLFLVLAVVARRRTTIADDQG